MSIITLSNLPIFGVLFFSFNTASAAGITISLLDKFMERTGAPVGCTLNAGADASSRNAIVWPKDDELRAIVFRSELPGTVPVNDPCWSSPGHCVVFEGELPAIATDCSDGIGFSGTRAGKLIKLSDMAMAPPSIPPLSQLLLELADGLDGTESLVSVIDSHPTFISVLPDGARRLRIEHYGGTIGVARLRPAIGEVGLNSIVTAASALGTREFELVGPEGALASDGRMYLDGACFMAASAEVIKNRLSAANAVIPIDSVPSTLDEAGTMRADFAQRLIGGAVAHGLPIQTTSEQDPRLFLMIPGETDLCP